MTNKMKIRECLSTAAAAAAVLCGILPLVRALTVNTIVWCIEAAVEQHTTATFSELYIYAEYKREYRH